MSRAYVPPHRRRRGNNNGSKRLTLSERYPNRNVLNYEKMVNNSGSDVARKAYQLLCTAGTYLIPDDNLYTFAIKNPDFEGVAEVIDTIYAYMDPKECGVKSEAEMVSDSPMFKFRFVSGYNSGDEVTRKFMSYYTDEMMVHIDEARKLIFKSIRGNEVLSHLYEIIVSKEKEFGFLFSTPPKVDDVFVDRVYKLLDIRNGSVRRVSGRELKKLDTRYKLDNVLKHGIKKNNSGEDFIGFVRKDNVPVKLKDYQKVRSRAAAKLIEDYGGNGLPKELEYVRTYVEADYVNGDPIEVANVEIMGEDNTDSSLWKCDFSQFGLENLLLDFVDPEHRIISAELVDRYYAFLNGKGSRDELIEELNRVRLSYNRRQNVFAFTRDITKYEFCNRFFRLMENYTDYFTDNGIELEGMSYSALFNKYYTIKTTVTNMMFPLRFILPSNRRQMGKHSGQISIEKYLKMYDFVGLIELKFLGKRLSKGFILIFKIRSEKPEIDWYTGRLSHFKLIDFRLQLVPIGHLDYQKNITYDELNVLSYLNVPVFQLKQQFNPTDTKILFVHNKNYASGDIPPAIMEKLESFNDFDFNVYKTTRYNQNRMLMYGGGKRSIEWYSNHIFNVIYYDTFHESEHKLPLTDLEFAYLLFPYIYVTDRQYSGFLSFKSSKYRNIYSLGRIVKDEGAKFNEISKVFGINTKGKKVLEINNYFSTTLVHIKDSDNLTLFLYPHIKYFSLDKDRVFKETLSTYYKNFNTRINKTFRVVKIEKQDLIVFNLIHYKETDYEYENEKDDLKLRKKMIEFIKLNLAKGGSLLFNIGYINLDGTQKIVLQLQKLFESVKLYRPTIQHVFKQVGLVLYAKGFGLSKGKGRGGGYSMMDLKVINEGIHLDKFKLYYDLFPYYFKFVESNRRLKMIKYEQEFQMICSYLYAKRWGLKFSIPIDKTFIKKLKDNLKRSLTSAGNYTYSFKTMKEYYMKFPKKFIRRKLDWSLEGYGDVGDKLRINREYAARWGYKEKNMVTEDFRYLDKGGVKMRLGTDDVVRQVWEMYIRYREIVVWRPEQVVGADVFYVVCKGARDDKCVVPKGIDKFFAEKMVEIIKEFTDMYSDRLRKEIELLKFSGKDLKRLL